MPLDVSEIQTEGKFVNVSLGVLWADMVKDAVDTALENRPNALNAVGVDRAACEVSGAVVDRGMAVEQTVKASVAGVFVAVDGGTNFDVVEQALLDGSEVRAVQNKRLRVAAALAHSENSGFANGTTAHVQLFVRVLVGLFAANESFIHFDDAFELVEVFAASLAQTVQHEPCRLLGDADFLRQLHRANSLASGDYEIHGVNPLMERNVAALENRSGANRERKLAASVAAVVTLWANRYLFSALALRADNAVRPQTTFQIEPGRLLIREPLEQLKRADSRFAHGRILLNSTGK